MIELPEAAVLAKQIKRTLTGKCIGQAIANQSPHRFAWYTGDPAEYNDRLAGKVIRDALPIGNHVEIRTDEMTLVISTPIRYHPSMNQLPRKHQLLLLFEDDTAVTCTVQMWGVLACFKEGASSGIPDYPVARQKPSPLSGAFDRVYFNSLFHEDTGELSAKAFLATEQRIPGLGNGVLQDILWTAKIHPRRKVSDLSAKEISEMYGAVKSILQKMTSQGGRDTENDLFGCPGSYKTILSKNTLGKPCPSCNTVITKETYLGGAIYFCEHCQKF